MKRTRRPFRQAGCAGLSGLACVHGPSTPHSACEVMGPSRPVTLEAARHYVTGFVRDTADRRETLARYIAATGLAVLHAAHEILGTPRCYCAACSNPSDPRRPWFIDSARIAREIGGAS